MFIIVKLNIEEKQAKKLLDDLLTECKSIDFEVE
jgi:hypothetical protein